MLSENTSGKKIKKMSNFNICVPSKRFFFHQLTGRPKDKTRKKKKNEEPAKHVKSYYILCLLVASDHRRII